MLCKQDVRVKALFICLVWEWEGDGRRASRVSSLSPLPSCLSVTAVSPVECRHQCRRVAEVLLPLSQRDGHASGLISAANCECAAGLCMCAAGRLTC